MLTCLMVSALLTNWEKQEHNTTNTTRNNTTYNITFTTNNTATNNINDTSNNNITNDIITITNNITKSTNNNITNDITYTTNKYTTVNITNLKLATLVQGDPRAHFSIATTQRCNRGGCYSIPRISPLYPWSSPYSAEC